MKRCILPEIRPSKKVPRELQRYPIISKATVQKKHHDEFGHVRYIHYLLWMEPSRRAWMNRVGIKPWINQKGDGPILVSVQCDYRSQVKQPDVILIGTRLSKIGNSSITFDHCLFSTKQNKVVAKGTSVIIMLHFPMEKPIRISEKIRRAIQRLEASSLRKN